MVAEGNRPLWVHLGILPEDEVNKRDETLNYDVLLQMANNAHKKRKRREQEIWAAQSQQSKTCKAADEMIYE